MWKAMFLRNVKLYFKDKAMFFTSLITPAILLVLYVTFLGNVYRDNFSAGFPEGFSLSRQVIDGAVGAQLLSSILAVCCVTVPFCSNMLMVQDKITGARKDLLIAPLKPAVLPVSYFLATVASSLIVCVRAVSGLRPCGGLVLYVGRRAAAYRRCGASGAVRNGTFLTDSLFPEYTGADLGGGYYCQCRLRFHLRGIHADLRLWNRSAKGAFLFAKHLCHRIDAKSRHGRRVTADAERGRTGRSGSRHTKSTGL